jgi:hypothetical protein
MLCPASGLASASERTAVVIERRVNSSQCTERSEVRALGAIRKPDLAETSARPPTNGKILPGNRMRASGVAGGLHSVTRSDLKLRPEDGLERGL